MRPRTSLPSGLTVITLASLILLPSRPLSAQPAIYHLHREASVTPGVLLLKQGAPDAAGTALQTIDLKNQPLGEYAVKEFETAVGDPNVAGSLGTGTSFTFSLWMKRTSGFGTLVPRVRIRLNGSSGPLLCQATGATALPSKLAPLTLACTTTASTVLATSDRLHIWVGVAMTATAGSHSQRAELDIEGALNGNYDSRVTVPLPPTIASISPSSAPVGTSVTIAGNGFGPLTSGNVVSFNGITAATSAWTSTSIQAAVPAAATSGPVTVLVNGARSTGFPFTVQVPVITSVEPPSGPPGTTVTLAGSGFETQPFASTVTLGGLAVSPLTWNDNRITFAVPAAAVSGPVVVVVNGKASAGVPFTVTGPPSLTGLTPTTGLPGSLVTISGTNLSSTGTVTFAGVTASVKSWAPTAVVASVPQTAASGNVIVDLRGVRSNGLPFTVSPAPAITALSPSTGNTGQVITISGSAFGATEASSTVTFNGLLADVRDWSDTTLSVVVPRDASTGPVVVRVAGRPSNGPTFSMPTATLAGTVTRASDGAPLPGAAIVAQAPSNSPSTAVTSRDGTFTLSLPPNTYTVQAIAAGHQPVTLTGQVLQAGTTTTVPIALVAAGDERAVRYEYDPGDRLVGVVDRSGASAAYRYDRSGNIVAIDRATTGQVTITSVSPLQGPAGTTVTVTGTAFSATPGQNTVTLAGSPATVTSATATRLTFLVPSTATTGSVTVATPDGSATSTASFVVTASSGVPSVTAATPTTVLQGQPVTITGSHFSTLPGSNRVTVNGVLAQVTSAAPTTLGIVVPSVMGGRLAVETALGPATTRPDLFIVPTLPSPYAVSDIAWTGRTALDSEVNVSIAAAGKQGLLLVDGDTGDGLSLRISGSTMADVHYRVYAPDGTIIREGDSYAPDGSGYVDSVALPRTGTYTIAIAPVSPYVGTLTLTPVRDASGTLVPNGGFVPVTIASAGQNARFTFEGEAGATVSASGRGFGSCSDFHLFVLKPDGSTLASGSASCMPSATTTQATLPATGTYTVVYDPDYAAVGTGALSLSLVNPLSASLPLNRQER